MDISKLPRMSKTTTPPNDAGDDVPVPPEAGFPALPPGEAPVNAAAPAPSVAAPTVWCLKCHAPNPPGTRFCGSCGNELQQGAVNYAPRSAAGVDPGAGAEAWISIAVGIILLFMAPNIIKFLLSPTAFEQSVNIMDEKGQPLAYTKSVFFWGDLAITLFAAVLIVEGLVISLGRKPMLVLGAFILTLIATALNLFYVAGMMSKGYGFQILSGLAVAFGVYIALYQWKLWNALRRK
jgi:hypothetical protein